ncbi:MAG TPA: hypothetical protein VJR50_27280 [Mycobacterium sp.]|nr:hypothetical protein [Mycobacterium sp.]
MRTQRSSDVYEAALSRLPEAHALILRLTEAGASADEICGQLDVEPESLEPLLDIAQRKLRNQLTNM